MTKNSQRYDFQNASGLTLSGRLEMPENPKAFAIFAHCFTCSKNILAATRVSRALGEQDIAVLRFDFTGIGNSEGDFSNTNFSSNLDDLRAAVSSLIETHEAPKLLIGHSLGGAAVLRISPELDSIQAVATIAAPSDVGHVSHLFQENIEIIEQQGEALVNLAGREFKIKKQFIDDIKEQDILGELGQSKKAYLVMHSPVDDTVSIDHATRIYSALKHPKSFVSLDQADHLVKNHEDAEFIAQIIGTWSKRYI